MLIIFLKKLNVSKSLFLLFLFVGQVPLFSAVNDTIINLSDNQMEGYIKINNSQNFNQLKKGDTIYDSVSFGNSFSISLYTETNNCLCEGGNAFPNWLKIHPGSSAMAAVVKNYKDTISDTSWNTAAKYPDSIKNIDTMCITCENKTHFKGNELAVYRDNGLDIPYMTRLSPAKTLKAIIYIKDSSNRLFKLQCTGFKDYALPQSPMSSATDFHYFTIHWGVVKNGSNSFDNVKVLTPLNNFTGRLTIISSCYDLRGRSIKQIQQAPAAKGIYLIAGEQKITRQLFWRDLNNVQKVLSLE